MIPRLRVRVVLVAVTPDEPDSGAQCVAERLATAARAQLVAFTPPARGVPAVELARAAERHGADLIVLAREPRDLVEAAVRRVRAPCLVVSRSDCAFHRILAAVDAGPDAEEILSVAAVIGELLGSDVEALHVERGTAFPASSHSSMLDLGTARTATAVEMLVRQGDPVTEILDVTRTEGIDLLVHGHHRCGPRNGHETGSVAARLLDRAPCAVLTVPI